MEKGYQENLLYKDLSYKLVGCVYNVYNQLGPGYKESIYTHALSIELKTSSIDFQQEKQILILYGNKKVGVYVPDFVIDDKIIIEIKAVEVMLRLYEQQLYTYLRGTKYKLGYLVNFGGAKIDIRRRVYDKAKFA